MQRYTRMIPRLRHFLNAGATAVVPAPPSVLIVDDEKAVASFVERVLAGNGWRTYVAHNGADALALAATLDGLDLLLTDLMMPEMSGDELARRLRSTLPDLPVLYFTGFGDRLFAERMLLWQDEAFLDKPSSPKGLLEAVAMASHRAIDGTLVASTVY